MRKMNMKRQINLSIFVRSVLMQGFPEAAVENTQALAFFRKKTCPRLDEFTQCLWHLFTLFSFSFLPLKLSTSIHVQGVVFLDLASLKWIPLSSSCNFPTHTQPFLFYVSITLLVRAAHLCSSCSTYAHWGILPLLLHLLQWQPKQSNGSRVPSMLIY